MDEVREEHRRVPIDVVAEQRRDESFGQGRGVGGREATAPDEVLIRGKEVSQGLRGRRLSKENTRVGLANGMGTINLNGRIVCIP